jgi:secreted trypsin-like serine protease
LVGPLEHLLVGALALAGTSAIEPQLVKAVAQIGPCSGTLVAADGVLTSAHCLNGPIAHVVVDGKVVRVAKCEQNGAYRPGLPAHDIGYCRLSEALPGALSIDDGQAPALGTTVSLAGFGLASAMSPERPALRRIATSVVGAKEGLLEAGTATATACRGDSGGPMLLERGGTFRVAGVIHGAQGAICASPTEVVPVSADRDWVLQRLDVGSNGFPRGARVPLGVLLVGAVVGTSFWWRRAHRRGRV